MQPDEFGTFSAIKLGNKISGEKFVIKTIKHF